jgi:hypothetical protein
MQSGNLESVKVGRATLMQYQGPKRAREAESNISDVLSITCRLPERLISPQSIVQQIN